MSGAPRRLAAEILADLLRRRLPLDDLLAIHLSRRRLKERDRAFVKALCYESCRWFHRLRFLLDQLVKERIGDLEIFCLALIGLCQLQQLEIQPYAAVYETVEAANQKPWAKGLLNAILRRYLRERKRLEAEADRDYEAQFSHPAWLRRRIETTWPRQAESVLEANNRHPPMTIRVNLTRTTLRQYAFRLAQAGLTARPIPGVPSALVLDRPVAVEALPGFAEGLVSVQDGAAQLAPYLLDLRPGQRVLDLCAAPGGKTLHLLEHCPNVREVVAVERSADRIAQLEENVARLGFQGRVRTIQADGRNLEAWWDGEPFDRILLDAPCSATGVIRRHPDIKLLRQEGEIPKLANLQAQLLDAASRCLKPGGQLLYVTCSILAQENHQQIRRWLRRNRSFRMGPLPEKWGHPTGFGLQILPGERDMDGFFYALLVAPD